MMSYGKDCLSEKNGDKDNDDIFFRPITDGLGFHQEEKEKEYLEKMFKPEIRRNVHIHKPPLLAPVIAPVISPVISTKLKKEEAPKPIAPVLTKPKPIHLQVLAFLIDLIFIFLFTTMLVMALIGIVLLMGNYTWVRGEEIAMVKGVLKALLQFKLWPHLVFLFLINSCLYFIFVRNWLGKNVGIKQKV